MYGEDFGRDRQVREIGVCSATAAQILPESLNPHVAYVGVCAADSA